MNILGFAGSLRVGSINKIFVREACRVAIGLGATGEYIDIKDYPMPVYDGDIETANGLPQTARQLGAKIRAADALVIATPEYNGSIPGGLKNILDWLSRDKPVSLAGKHLLLLAASPGAYGGLRVLWHIRQPFEALGVHVYPGAIGLPKSHEAFDDTGQLKDPKIAQQLHDGLSKFIKHVSG